VKVALKTREREPREKRGGKLAVSSEAEREERPKKRAKRGVGNPHARATRGPRPHIPTRRKRKSTMKKGEQTVTLFVQYPEGNLVSNTEGTMGDPFLSSKADNSARENENPHQHLEKKKRKGNGHWKTGSRQGKLTD